MNYLLMFVNYLLIMLASSKFIVGFIMRTLNFHKCDKMGLLFKINIHHATLYILFSLFFHTAYLF